MDIELIFFLERFFFLKKKKLKWLFTMIIRFRKQFFRRHIGPKGKLLL